MSELHDKLRATVAELHTELAALPEVDSEARAVLEGAIRDIQQTIGSTSRKGPDDGTLAARLNDAASHFEVSHPTLSGIISSTVDAPGPDGDLAACGTTVGRTSGPSETACAALIEFTRTDQRSVLRSSVITHSG